MKTKSLLSTLIVLFVINAMGQNNKTFVHFNGLGFEPKYENAQVAFIKNSENKNDTLYFISDYETPFKVKTQEDCIKIYDKKTDKELHTIDIKKKWKADIRVGMDRKTLVGVLYKKNNVQPFVTTFDGQTMNTHFHKKFNLPEDEGRLEEILLSSTSNEMLIIYDHNQHYAPTSHKIIKYNYQTNSHEVLDKQFEPKGFNLSHCGNYLKYKERYDEKLYDIKNSKDIPFMYLGKDATKIECYRGDPGMCNNLGKPIDNIVLFVHPEIDGYLFVAGDGAFLYKGNEIPKYFYLTNEKDEIIEIIRESPFYDKFNKVKNTLSNSYKKRFLARLAWPDLPQEDCNEIFQRIASDKFSDKLEFIDHSEHIVWQYYLNDIVHAAYNMSESELVGFGPDNCKKIYEYLRICGLNLEQFSKKFGIEKRELESGLKKLGILTQGSDYRIPQEMQKEFDSFIENGDAQKLAQEKARVESVNKRKKEISIYGKQQIKINTGHFTPVTTVEYSPNGKILATASKSSRIIKLWDFESGRELKSLTGFFRGEMHFAPNGQYLAVRADNAIVFWNIVTGNIDKEITGLDNQGICFAFSPATESDPSGGRFFAFGNGRKIIIRDMQTNSDLKEYTRHPQNVVSLAWSPDARFIASHSHKGEIRIWNVNTLENRVVFGDYHGGYDNEIITKLEFIDNGKKIAEKGGSLIKIYDAETGQKLNWYDKYKSLSDVTFSPLENSFITAGDKNMYLWNINNADNKYTADITETDKQVAKRVTAENRSIRKRMNGFEWQDYLDENRRKVKSVAYSPDGKYLATGNEDGTCVILSTENFESLKELNSWTKPLGIVSANPNGEKLFIKDESYFQFFDINTGSFAEREFGTIKYLKSGYSSNGTYLWVVGENDIVPTIWNMQTGERNYLKGRLKPNPRKEYYYEHSKGVNVVAFSPDEKAMVTGGADSRLAFWKHPDVFIDRLITESPVTDIEYSNDGNEIVFATEDSIISFIDANTKEFLRKFNIASTDFHFISPSNMIASINNEALKIWNSTDGSLIKNIKTKQKIRDYRFSIDGKYFITNYNNVLGYWDVNAGKLIWTYKTESTILGISFSADGQRVYLTTSEGFFKIIDAKTKNDIVTYILVNDKKDWLAYTPDGYWMGTNNSDKYVAIVEGLNAYNIDQFAVKSNRPDIILERLGSKSQDLINHYHAQYLKRLRKLKITEEALKNDTKVPESSIVDFSEDGKFATIRFKLSDNNYKLVSYNVYVNDVPIYGIGKPTGGNIQEITEKVELVNGDNKIEVSCRNELGLESYRDVVSVKYTGGEVKPDLYYLGIGVSKYKNPDLNLLYAHKDAIDIENVAQRFKERNFRNVYTKVLVNEQATAENIRAAKSLLKNSRPDDVFILFIAGHGVHDRDEESTYYFLTHNTDLNNLAGTAINFESIEDLLQGIPPRNKLFLMDACESGEKEEDDSYSTVLAEAQNRGLKSRGFKKTNTTGIKNVKSTSKKIIIPDKNRYIYNDLYRRSGAIVFSSSRGSELSYEFDELQNGLFTEYIIKALTTIEADSVRDDFITSDELRNYVASEVSKFSKGAQNPTVDRDNIHMKIGFNIAEVKQVESAGLWPSLYYNNQVSAPIMGEFKDPRDGKKYKTVTYNYVYTDKSVVTQTWMAQSLNFKMNGAKKYSNKTGALYTYAMAMNACPDGWRLPTMEDWNRLTTHFAGDPEALKSKTGWNTTGFGRLPDGSYGDRSGNGNNKSGFNAIPKGGLDNYGKIDKSGNYAGFMTQPWKDYRGSLTFYGFTINDAHIINYDEMLPVRCIKKDE